MTWKQVLLLIAIAIVILFMPLLITRTWFGHISEFGGSTGPVGDTIGGITAPFIGLMSSILVYLAFKEQVKANRLVQTQLNAESFRETVKTFYDKIEKQKHDFFVLTGTGQPGIEMDRIVEYLKSVLGIAAEMHKYETGTYEPGATVYPGVLKEYLNNIIDNYTIEIKKLNIIYGFILHHFNYLHNAALRAKTDKNYELLDFARICIEEFNEYVDNNFLMIHISNHKDIAALNQTTEMFILYRLFLRIESVIETKSMIENFTYFSILDPKK